MISKQNIHPCEHDRIYLHVPEDLREVCYISLVYAPRCDAVERRRCASILQNIEATSHQ